MKILNRLFLVTLMVGSLTGCLFKDAVFEQGFSKLDPALGGVWVSDGKDGDPRKMEFAVCAPFDDDHYVLNHPSTEKGSLFYEARLVKVRDRSLLQLRLLASFNDGLPKADAERYTLVWIEKDSAGAGLKVRSLGGEGVKEKGAAEIRRLLEAPATDWNSLFGEPIIFRKIWKRTTEQLSPCARAGCAFIRRVDIANEGGETRHSQRLSCQ